MQHNESPRVPLDLAPFSSLPRRLGAFGGEAVRQLLNEIIAERGERNRIAKECAELHSQLEDAQTRLTLLDPVVDAALIFDDADAANDDPELHDIDTAAEVLIAAGTLRHACETYRAATRTVLADQ